jgi:hypothetical protein
VPGAAPAPVLPLHVGDAVALERLDDQRALGLDAEAVLDLGIALVEGLADVLANNVH